MLNCSPVRARREWLCYNGGMTVSYGTLLRDKVGDPTVYKNLWELVTSVGEGDAHMYGEVLLALDWLSWRDFESREYDTAQFRWAYMMLSDRRLPGGALETLFSNGRVCNGFRASIAAHKNITERLERDALLSKSALVREALAGKTPRLAATL